MDLPLIQPGLWGSDVVFVRQVNPADSRIIGVNRRCNAGFEEPSERVSGIIRHTTGLHVTGETGFHTNFVFDKEVQQGWIFSGAAGRGQCARRPVPAGLPRWIPARQFPRRER